jgi:uncharacterized membrane protein
VSEWLKILLGALGGAVFALLLLRCLSGIGMRYGMMGGGLFGVLSVELLWVLVVVGLVVWIVARVQRR